ncbi:MAG TPA: sigma-70 family RNA polymerase sigma factor, partial [Euzebya sp.]|nr:sigma-70 family RNA polymerase sigma factor [Euzebya sp.]
MTRMRASEPDIGLQLYDRFADRIHDFVLFLTRDWTMAAGTTSDVIVMTASQDPAVLSDPATLRAWLYAQARNETFAVLSSRGRTPAADRVVEVPELPDSPTTADLGSLVWTAVAAFSERDQALVTLHLRHGLDGEALADAMGLSIGAIDMLLPTTLERVETQTAALLALATNQLPSCCPELQAVAAEWDGMFSPLVRGRVTQMLHECTAPQPDGAGPMALLQTIPLCPAPASLRESVAERLAMASRLGAGGTAVDPEIDDTIPPGVAAGTVAASATDPGGEEPVGGVSDQPAASMMTARTPHDLPLVGPADEDQVPDNQHEVQGHAVRDEAVQGDAVQGDAVQGEAVQGEAVQGEAVRGDAVRSDAVQ